MRTDAILAGDPSQEANPETQVPIPVFLTKFVPVSKPGYFAAPDLEWNWNRGHEE